ncbi:hypothetical protein C8R44DRAFT_744403 [Mycena epipterygia]|nr:hypothetical protein C8R44DRAFT_744403 [Mycena epipterygia]
MRDRREPSLAVTTLGTLPPANMFIAMRMPAGCGQQSPGVGPLKQREMMSPVLTCANVRGAVRHWQNARAKLEQSNAAPISKQLNRSWPKDSEGGCREDGA